MACGVLTLLLAGGCEGPSGGRLSYEKIPAVDPDLNPNALRSSMYEALVNFTADVERTSDRIREQSDDPQVQRNALLWKLNAIPAMRQACFREEPLTAAMDAWVLTVQMDEYFDGGAGSGLFGPYQHEAIATANEQRDEARRIWLKFARSPEAAAKTEEETINTFAAEHPITDISFARDSSVARFSDLAEGGGGAIDRVASLDEQVSLLAHQVRIVAPGVPKQVRGEVDLLRLELLGSQGLEPIVSSVGSIGESVERATRVAEDTHEFVSSERVEILEGVDEQRRMATDDVRAEITRVIETVGSERAAVLDSVRNERLAVMEGIALERGRILEGVGSERSIVLEDVSRQRLETLDRVEEKISAERELILAEAGVIVDTAVGRINEQIVRVVDIILIRVVLLIAVGIVIAPIVAHVYVRVWPRANA